MHLLPPTTGLALIAFALVCGDAAAQQDGSEIVKALRGCWDRLPWAERQARLAGDPTIVWEQAICFDDAGRMWINILGGGGKFTDDNGDTYTLGIEGWGEEGSYVVADGRIDIRFDPGETWMAEHFPRATCGVGMEGDLLTFSSCVVWGPEPVDGRNYVAVSDSEFRRNDWDIEAMK